MTDKLDVDIYCFAVKGFINNLIITTPASYLSTQDNIHFPITNWYNCADIQ